MSVNFNVWSKPTTPCTTLTQCSSDIQQHIFSYLEKEALQAATCLNKDMGHKAITAANVNEPARIKNFIHVLISGLDAGRFSEKIEMLLEISHNVTSPECANLLTLRPYILRVRRQLINVIKTLDPETIENLKNSVHLPSFFEKIFILVALERQINETNPNTYEGARALRDISKAIAQAGDIDRAIEVATSILNGQSNFALMDISTVLAQAGNIDRAIAVATSIPTDLSGLTLRDISRILMQAGDIDRAIAVAKSIPNGQIEFALVDISRILAQAGDIDRAIAVATSIPNGYSWFAFRDISKILVQAGNIDRAIAVATSIPIEFMKEGALRDISIVLAQAGNIDRAIAVANLIPRENVRKRAVSAISQASAQAGDIDQARGAKRRRYR
ncbi:MAG TPA: hypothetical protein VLE95_09055 [Chlamydiales bacterium]|nr:hypothetical protein [Chlamydiales bacterium]